MPQALTEVDLEITAPARGERKIQKKIQQRMCFTHTDVCKKKTGIHSSLKNLRTEIETTYNEAKKDTYITMCVTFGETGECTLSKKTSLQ